jgi:uncharacterized membrane protein
MPTAANFFSTEHKEAIVAAIRRAELMTSGEIRVHLETAHKLPAYDRAKQLFEQLKMHRTEQRNGVLFYLAINTRTFAILGDKGIHDKVGPDFWTHIKDDMAVHFREGRFTEGLVRGIDAAGKALQSFFPRKDNDQNELSDAISFTD